MVENETLRTVISGTAGGMASILAVHPLDTVRTRLQAAPAGAYRGAWHCARVTLRREGPLALYKGLAWPLAAQGLWNPAPFERSLSDGEYPVVVLPFDPRNQVGGAHAQRWTKGELAAFRLAPVVESLPTGRWVARW